MDITISVSEKTAEIIRHKAEETGKAVADFVGDLLEEKLAEPVQNQPRKKKLSEFAGMFSGGDGKTSENYKKILRDEIDSVAGFTTDREK